MTNFLGGVPEQVGLSIQRLGWFRGDLRILLQRTATQELAYVVELEQLYCYVGFGQVNSAAVSVRTGIPGSLGWHFGPEIRGDVTELCVTDMQDPSRILLRALARHVRFREYNPGVDLHYPS